MGRNLLMSFIIRFITESQVKGIVAGFIAQSHIILMFTFLSFAVLVSTVLSASALSLEPETTHITGERPLLEPNYS